MGNLKIYYNNIPYNEEGREITKCVKHGYGWYKDTVVLEMKISISKMKNYTGRD